jgi:hypothetical protein
MPSSEIEARVRLRALVDAYAHCADVRDYEGFAALFTEDGELTAVQPGREPFFRARGQKALAAVVHGNDAFPRTFHFVGNHHCTVDGSTATGVTYCTARHLRAEGAEVEAITWLIRYHDDFVETSDGWRFDRREIELVWVEYAEADTSEFPFRKRWPGA